MLSSLFVSLALIATSAFAAPVKVARSPNYPRSRLTTNVRFNGWGGFQSLHNFDDFYGWDNFDGHKNQRIIVKEKQLVCHKVEVEHVQQQLVIIQEHVKRLIVEQVCEVEVQTILLAQWTKRFDSWHHDVRRKSKRVVSFDHEIAGHFRDLVDENHVIRSHNWGFKGFDVGRRSVHVINDNWDHNISPHRVDWAFWDSWGYRDFYGFDFPEQGFDWFKSHPNFRFDPSDFGRFDEGRFDSGRFPSDDEHSPSFSYFPGSGKIVGPDGNEFAPPPPVDDDVNDDVDDDVDDDVSDGDNTGLPTTTGSDAVPTETGTTSSAIPTVSAPADAGAGADAAQNPPAA